MTTRVPPAVRARRRRLAVASAGAIGILGAATLAMLGLQDAAAFFRTPSEILEAHGAGGPSRAVRVGGLVTREAPSGDDAAILFHLADDVSGFDVRYVGPRPNLFREGQCVIAEGALGPDGVFAATRLIAKHDEAYKAPEIDAAPRLAKSCGEMQSPQA